MRQTPPPGAMPDHRPRCPAMLDGVCTRWADGANWCEPGECCDEGVSFSTGKVCEACDGFGWREP